MKTFSVKDLNKLIDQTSKEDKSIHKIFIGYKLFLELMNDLEFFEEVKNSAHSPNHRKYKKLKIKVTTNEYQLYFE